MYCPDFLLKIPHKVLHLSAEPEINPQISFFIKWFIKINSLTKLLKSKNLVLQIYIVLNSRLNVVGRLKILAVKRVYNVRIEISRVYIYPLLPHFLPGLAGTPSPWRKIILLRLCILLNFPTKGSHSLSL